MVDAFKYLETVKGDETEQEYPYRAEVCSHYYCDPMKSPLPITVWSH